MGVNNERSGEGLHLYRDKAQRRGAEEEAAVLRQQPGRVHGRAAEEATEGVIAVFVAKRLTNSFSSC